MFDIKEKYFDSADPARFDSPRLEAATADHLVRWAIEQFADRLVLVTSFQAEGMVLLDMAVKLAPGLRIATLDTGRLPAETHEFIQQVRRRYGTKVEVISPDPSALSELVTTGGPNLFYDSTDGRRSCCRVRKVGPLQRLLADADAWFTGLRRDQAPSRAGIGKVEVDTAHGDVLKLSPLADWTWEQVWDYLRQHRVPIHPLYRQGYTSIGCAPCTRPTQAGEDLRAGRWWWETEGPKECGLHLPWVASAPPGGLVTLGNSGNGR